MIYIEVNGRFKGFCFYFRRFLKNGMLRKDVEFFWFFQRIKQNLDLEYNLEEFLVDMDLVLCLSRYSKWIG